ncbi:MAG: ATP-grasp domain-containing protein [Bacteroidales bacterium]|nr:ATP-grasp domain-containing protein [Bacteroidales bacterium]
MAAYKTIAVVYGSDSSEWEVACRSGEFTASRIDGYKYDIYEIFARFGRWQLVAYKKKDAMRVPLPEGSRPEVDKTDFSVNVLGEKVNFDYVYIMQHGAPGESGQLQGYFEMLGIPFSSCSSSVSAIAFDKYACKSYIRDLGIVKCAPDAFVHKGADIDAFAGQIAGKLKFPVFVKPTIGGSSFGVTMVKDPSGVATAVKYAFSEGPTVLVEQGIHGRELTCAAYRTGGVVHTLPIIEILSDNEYFDYDAKYNGHSREVCPADATPEIVKLVQETTAHIYDNLDCSGVVRMDYILAEDGLYFLEVNTIPGMTSASLVPKMVRAAGLDMTDFLSDIIENG